MRERLCVAGIDLKRVRTGPGMPRQSCLEQHAEVDVLLDTLPYPGGSSTVEANWMGVPTLTLATPGLPGRQGQAMLENMGLGNWVAQSEDDYLVKAVALAQGKAVAVELWRLIRRDLRDTARRSSLVTALAFAKALEILLRGDCAQTAG